MSRPAFADRLVAFLAALACLALSVGLRDTPRPRGTSPAEVDSAGLAVHVQARGGAKLSGAEVWLYLAERARFRFAGKALTNKRGEALFSAVKPGLHWALVEKPEYARSSTAMAMRGRTQAVSVTLERASSLTVHVAGPGDEPIRGATVLVHSGDALPFGALTDAAGRAELQRLGQPPFKVKISAPGYESVEQNADSELSVNLTPLRTLIVTTVNSAGTKLGDAEVLISGANLWPARQAKTEESGEAIITGLAPGSYDLSARHGTMISDTFLGMELGEQPESHITLRLEPGRMVTVQVVEARSDNQRVVAGADVALAERGLSTFPLRGSTGTDGRVVLGPVGGGAHSVSVSATDFVARHAVTVPDSTEPLLVPLVRAATLEGEVVDERGFPIPGASIEIVGTDTYGGPIAESPIGIEFARAHLEWTTIGPLPLIPAGQLGVTPGPVPPIPGAGFDLGMPRTPRQQQLELWVTNQSGHFVAKPVTPGQLHALVRHPEYLATLSDSVALPPGGRGKVRVVLRTGNLLRGRIFDHREQPLGMARVDIYGQSGTFESTTFTAADGTFAFASVPIEVVLTVFRPESFERIALRQTLSKPQETELQLKLAEPRGPTMITVADAAGAPVELAQVEVASLDVETPLRTTLFTNAAGRVSVDDVAGLPLSIVVEGTGFVTAHHQTASAPEELTLELGRGQIVEGTLTAVRGRRPVSGAQVSLLVDGRRRLTFSGPDGSYRFEQVPPRTITLEVEHPEYAHHSQRVAVADTGRADRAFTIDAIDLTEPGSVTGVVLDETLEPVAGARVGVGLVPAFVQAGSVGPNMAVTDSDGRFSLGSLPAGNLTLGAYSATAGRGTLENVHVGAGQTSSNLELVLRKDGSGSDPVLQGSLALTLGEAPGVVVVVQVAENSEAERAGIQAGDTLLAVDGQPPHDMADARKRLNGPPSSGVLLSIDRAGRRLSLHATREQVRR